MNASRTCEACGVVRRGPGRSPGPRAPGGALGLGLALAVVLAGGWGRAAGEEPVSGESAGVMDRLRSMSMEELLEVRIGRVYAASKRDQRISEAPASVNVVTADEIRKFGYRTLAEVLRGVRGFYTSYDRTYSYIGVRGINRPGDYGGRVLILVNGHRLNDPIYGSADNGGEFPIDLDLVERIEVVRGPGHTLYGDNAMVAVINVVPKTGARLNGVEASTSVMSQEDYTGRVSYGTRTRGGVEVLVSGTFRERAGHEDLYFPEHSAVNGGVSVGLDGESVKQWYASVAYEGLTLSGFFGERRKDIPAAQYEAVFNQGPNWVRDTRWGFDARFEREFGDAWQVLGRGYVDGYTYGWVGPYASSDPLHPLPYVLNEDYSEALMAGVEAEVSRMFLERHRLALGAEFRADPTLFQRNWDRYDPEVEIVNSRVSEERAGVYLQDEYYVRPDLILGGAVRYDYFTAFDDAVNPRASLIWNPRERATFKLLYAEAFRSPNASERFYAYPGYLPNPGLDPERSRSYEAVWEARWGERWRTAVTAFYQDLTGFIAQTPDGAGNYIYANLDDLTSLGGEFEVEGRWENGLVARVSYTYASVEERRPGMGGQRPANSPEHLAKGALSVPLYRDRVFGSVEVQAMSGRHTVGGDEVGAYGTANLVLFGRELWPGLEVTAGIYNLFDTRYSDPVSVDFLRDRVEQDGRTFRAKVSYRF